MIRLTPDGLLYSPYAIDKVASAVEKVAKVFRKRSGERRNYGYFCARRRKDGRVLWIAQIGECPPDKAQKYMDLALEKGLRLFMRNSLNGHVSSFQSRNPDLYRWGGAICLSHLIFSFSGLPELGDEAAMLKLARDFNAIGQGRLRKIIAASNNHIAWQVLGMR